MNFGRRTGNRLLYINQKATLFILLVVVTTSLVASCGTEAEPVPVAVRHPFDMEITSEDGSLVTWDGYTDGYFPGETETTRLGVKNGTDQPWFGRICLSLLEPRPSDVVLPLEEREFTLAPGDGFQDIVSFQFPADLPVGRYGLTMVIHQPAGPVVAVTSIQIEEGGEPEINRLPPAGTWPSEAALQACQ
jgi:hypothetical protein